MAKETQVKKVKITMLQDVTYDNKLFVKGKTYEVTEVDALNLKPFIK
jgi:hypothetical protein